MVDRKALRRLLDQAIDVGYAKREWQEAVERATEKNDHPAYLRDVEAEVAFYREMLAKLEEMATFYTALEEPACLPGSDPGQRAP